jgi:hypothetical protein
MSSRPYPTFNADQLRELENGDYVCRTHNLDETDNHCTKIK